MAPRDFHGVIFMERTTWFSGGNLKNIREKFSKSKNKPIFDFSQLQERAARIA
jgi:hypothetical protein